MKVVFPICCGVDVHKTFVVATIITTPADSLQPIYQKKRFSTFNSDLNRFADWLLEKDNPYFARAAVNRVWHWIFGRGIMPETDNLALLPGFWGRIFSKVLCRRLLPLSSRSRRPIRNWPLPCSKPCRAVP